MILVKRKVKQCVKRTTDEWTRSVYSLKSIFPNDEQPRTCGGICRCLRLDREQTVSKASRKETVTARSYGHRCSCTDSDRNSRYNSVYLFHCNPFLAYSFDLI